MTGRDLIIYILTNGLEDEPVFKDGRFIGFKTTTEVAVALGVGPATVEAMIEKGMIQGVKIENTIYVPANSWVLSGCKRKE